MEKNFDITKPTCPLVFRYIEFPLYRGYILMFVTL